MGHGRGAGTLARAIIGSAAAVPFTGVQSSTDVDFLRGNFSTTIATPGIRPTTAGVTITTTCVATTSISSPATTGQRTRHDAAKGCRRKPVKVTPTETCLLHLNTPCEMAYVILLPTVEPRSRKPTGIRP
jgi:hypothetical protein